MRERSQLRQPQIISELNANLGTNEVTVEGIAEKLGINIVTLYKWVRLDREFLDALRIVKEVQEDDPFKIGAIEDVHVNKMIITLLLLETKDRHYKAQNS